MHISCTKYVFYLHIFCMSYEVTPYYWASSTERAEVDFAVNHFGLDRAVRTSLAGYRDEGWLLNLPLWAIGQLSNTDMRRSMTQD